jgi:organic hydroperoxide reductase OsmC/OhrA
MPTSVAIIHAPQDTPTLLETDAMSHHSATIEWQRHDDDFLDQRYSRRHVWRFDGGVDVIASASPQVVPVPLSDPAAVDPEEAFVAALSSCHMLWFLGIAARRGYRVDRYRDLADGILGRNAAGRLSITEVTLHPEVVWAGAPRPTPDIVEAMHEEAHRECFLANSVTTTVRCLPVHADA